MTRTNSRKRKRKPDGAPAADRPRRRVFPKRPIEERGRVVYVQLRYFDPVLRKQRHAKGLGLVFDNYTPQQVYDLIVEAGKRDQERIRSAKETATDGKEPPEAQSRPGPDRGRGAIPLDRPTERAERTVPTLGAGDSRTIGAGIARTD